MYLSISSQFTLKDRPAEYRGITGEHVTFAKERPSSLAQMCMDLLERTFDWYCIIDEAKDLNAELKLLVAWLNGIHFEAKSPDPDDATLELPENVAVMEGQENTEEE